MKNINLQLFQISFSSWDIRIYLISKCHTYDITLRNDLLKKPVYHGNYRGSTFSVTESTHAVSQWYQVVSLNNHKDILDFSTSHYAMWCHKYDIYISNKWEYLKN